MMFKACKGYTYLGVIITNSGQCERETGERINKGKNPLETLNRSFGLRISPTTEKYNYIM